MWRAGHDQASLDVGVPSRWRSFLPIRHSDRGGFHRTQPWCADAILYSAEPTDRHHSVGSTRTRVAPRQTSRWHAYTDRVRWRSSGPDTAALPRRCLRRGHGTERWKPAALCALDRRHGPDFLHGRASGRHHSPRFCSGGADAHPLDHRQQGSAEGRGGQTTWRSPSGPVLRPPLAYH